MCGFSIHGQPVFSSTLCLQNLECVKLLPGVISSCQAFHSPLRNVGESTKLVENFLLGDEDYLRRNDLTSRQSRASRHTREKPKGTQRQHSPTPSFGDCGGCHRRPLCIRQITHLISQNATLDLFRFPVFCGVTLFLPAGESSALSQFVAGSGSVCW